MPNCTRSLGDQIPARERQRVEIVDLLADDDPLGDVALRQPHHAGFRLAVEDEVAVAVEQLRHLRRRDADEPDLDAARAHPIGPRRFVLVIDQRRQHERDVAILRSPRVQVTSCPARARMAAM